MSDYYKGRCYEKVLESTNILGKDRVCVNGDGKAFKPINKWKYINPKFGGANNFNKYIDLNGTAKTGNGKKSNQEYIEKTSDFGVKYAYLIQQCDESDQVGSCELNVKLMVREL